MGTSGAAAEAAMTGPRAGKSQAAFRTISEVADELDVAQHVLRFWESKFPQVRPLKRGGGRRYYRPEDIELLREIRTLLYGEGYTIKGAQKLLRQRRAKPAPAAKAAEQPAEPSPAGTAARAEATGPDAPSGSAPTEPAPTEPAPTEPAAVEAPSAEQPSGVPQAAATLDPSSSQHGTPRPPVTAEFERLQALRRLMSEIRQELDVALAADD